MNSLRRMLAILDLFSQEKPTIDVDYICQALNYTAPSTYRYLRELINAGLLVRIPSGYTLGPRVIELDRQMKEYDPILVASRELIEELTEITGLNVLLSELYNATVISVHQSAGREILPLNYGRGRPMDLFRSATARVILAYLLPRQLRRIYDQHVEAHSLEFIGDDWKAFSKAMLQIRKQGYCVSTGELDPDKTGLAAPIFDEKNRVLGSITLVGSTQRFRAFSEAHLAEMLMQAAAAITQRIAQNA